MACPNCGSWAVRADRSLAGRLVCARCGEPLGIGASRRPSAIRRRGRTGLSARRRGLRLGVVALVVISAILAALPQRQLPLPARERFDPSRARSRQHSPGTRARRNELVRVFPSADRGNSIPCLYRMMGTSYST
jgi:hypothetical protein